MALGNNARLSDQIRIDSVYDPAGDTDLTTAMIDMKDYDGCLVLLIPGPTTASGSHLITAFGVVSNTTSAGGGTDHVIADAVTGDGATATTALTLASANMGTAVPTVLHNQLMALDIRADQMYAGDRYICAVLESTGTYGVCIVYIRYRGNANYKDMIQGTRLTFQHDGEVT
jgi:hypothetical protein